jgi:excisionase family DNA binding protein
MDMSDKSIGAPPGPAACVDEGFVDVAGAAEFLRLSRAKVYLLMDAGELRYAKFGKSRRIPWAALKQFAESRLVVR